MTIETVPLSPAIDHSAADRWFHVFMAALFVAIAVAGFAPTSLALLAAVEAGERPPPPLILNVHAFLMVSWLALFLTQTLLMALGRSRAHKTLGLISFVLAPAMIAAMIGVTVQGYGRVAAAPPEANVPPITFIGNLQLTVIQTVTLFALFVGWAIAVRRRDSETHKRLLLLATILPLIAAIDRMANTGLWTTLPDSYFSTHAYVLLLMALAVAFDVLRRGAPHRTYVIGVGLYIATSLPVLLLWNTPWWLETVPKLMGVAQ